ncbi:MAG: 2-hydroxychromene-2-carboxylate isomerase [Gammaproteobacteria bacterium]
MRVEFYFDFISPFSYLAHEQLNRLPHGTRLSCVPVLFAGLLNHWQTKGPAELPSQRLFTYRYCHWLARRIGIPFRVPESHPFDPLPPLRLAIALGNRPEAIRRIFRYLWRDGLTPAQTTDWQALINSFDQPGLAERLNEARVKQQLRDNTQLAIGQGVFGVPTFRVEGELFWGQDALPFLADYLSDPALLREPEMERLATLPSSAQRR